MVKHKIIEFVCTLADGGAETIVKDYALKLNKEEFEVIILTLFNHTDTANYKRVMENGIKVISIYPDYSIMTRFRRKFFGESFIPRRLAKFIRSEKPEVIHAHLELLWYLREAESALENIKLFYTCHSLPSQMFSGENAREMIAAKYLIEHNGLKMIALHEDMAKEINSMLGIQDTIVIKNGIDIDSFRNIDGSKEEIRASLGIPSDAFVMGHVGRFCEEKNHALLVKVFHELIRRRNDAYLLMVGHGELLEAIIAKIEFPDRVKVLSHRADVPSLLKAMDVFVFPSKYEGFGISIVEAETVGLRCIISDVVNSSVIISDATIKMSIEDTPEHWVDAILNDDKKGKAFGNIDDFDMNKEIKKLERLYLN